jgi:hypothetical protein
MNKPEITTTLVFHSTGNGNVIITSKATGEQLKGEALNSVITRLNVEAEYAEALENRNDLLETKLTKAQAEIDKLIGKEIQ